MEQEDQRRFRLIPFTEMTPEQRKYADAVMAGPTSSTGSAAVVPGASTEWFAHHRLVSMILNVDRAPIPGGGKPPLPILKRPLP
jgi:hypothetical protein